MAVACSVTRTFVIRKLHVTNPPNTHVDTEVSGIRVFGALSCDFQKAQDGCVVRLEEICLMSTLNAPTQGRAVSAAACIQC